ncbi:LysR family transcriptional regulator [Streptomyces sp. WI04-05A]|uniref:LysR family transcriptional regulator n=1 Tax=Streptomyces TaxID=1883 RepID=UPI0029A414E8|nr:MULTISPECIES: LysR family transcriptional regulator [unclassified Streptomyces]MDX2588039.1 LysR family transcriptional regulator [Streptomyces sp. WI04-05A]
MSLPTAVFIASRTAQHSARKTSPDPAISTAIALVERRVGVPLLERTMRKVTLTAETNLRRPRQAFQLYEEALRQLTIGNTVLRQVATVVAFSGRARPGSAARN